MNAYEHKQEERRERLEAKAEALRSAATAKSAAAHEKASVIPFGQPILVGHHSEGRDRRFRASIRKGMEQAIELDKKAEYYERKAASVGTGGISSDDPDAIQKLQEKLAGLEAVQEKMKAANRLVRKGDTAGLIALDFSEKDAADLMKPDFAGRAGFPSYALTNNNNQIRRIRERIQSLQNIAARESVEQEGSGYRYAEDIDDNRCKFFFDEKPSEQVRELLKRNGFRWSPKREGQPWVRKISNGALYAAETIRKQLDAQQ